MGRILFGLLASAALVSSGSQVAAQPAGTAKDKNQGSFYLQCDGNPNNMSAGEGIARFIGAVTLLALFAPPVEAADAAKRKFGAAGAAACSQLIDGEKAEGNTARRLPLILARAIHHIEAKDYSAAVLDAQKARARHATEADTAARQAEEAELRLAAVARDVASADEPLAGYFISDKADEPLRHELDPSLVVPAGGVLLLWADNDPEQGPAHLSFKLKAVGEAVYLTGPSGKIIDSVEYDAAPGDEAMGRSPDGTGSLAWCAVATPGELNQSSCQ